MLLCLFLFKQNSAWFLFYSYSLIKVVGCELFFGRGTIAVGGVFVSMCLPYALLQYCWIKPAASEPQRACGPRRRALPSTVRGKAAFRIGIYVYIHFSCSMFHINTGRLHVTPCYCLPSQTKHSNFSIPGCTP